MTQQQDNKRKFQISSCQKLQATQQHDNTDGNGNNNDLSLIRQIDSEDQMSSFDMLTSKVRQLQQLYGQDTIQLLPSSEIVSDNNTFVSIKSLVFTLQQQPQPTSLVSNYEQDDSIDSVIQVIVPSQYQVDTVKLLDILKKADLNINNNGDSTTAKPLSVSLAPSDQLRRICGFEAGTVPPLGLDPTPHRIIVDKTLIENESPPQQLENHDGDDNRMVVVGGGGHPDWRCVVSISLLLKQPCVQIADIILLTLEDAPIVNGAGSKSATITISDRVFPKPFFPLSPPSRRWAEWFLQNPDDANEKLLEQHTEWVTLVGRITSVRRLAKQLVFCDLVPPMSSGDGSISSDVHPWRSASDQQDMAVQLIAGKTLYQEQGEDAASMLKTGQLVLIQVRTNVQRRDSLINWLTKRSLDLVVASCQILQEPLLQQQLPNDSPSFNNRVKSSSKQQRQKGPVAGPILRQSKELANAITATPSASFTFLTLADILGEWKVGNSHKVVMVEDMESVHEFASCLASSLLSLTTSSSSSSNDDDENGASNGFVAMSELTTRFGWIGIDCEWKPWLHVDDPDEAQPVLVLQVCMMHPVNRVFLFDLQRLLRPLCAPTEPMNDLEAAVSEALTDLWLSSRLLKCGFQLIADLRRLAASYPHIPAFQQVNAVVEVSSLAKRVLNLTGQRNSRTWTSSLARLTEFFLSKTLDKEQQVSDWSRRPLSPEQVEYAALDAAISAKLVESALETIQAKIVSDETYETFVPRLSRWQGDDGALASFIQSWRFQFLNSDDASAVRKLRAKKIVGDLLVITQSWITGRIAPNAPTAPVNDGPFTDVHGAVRIPTRAVSLSNPSTRLTLQSLIGQSVAKSKERCLQTILKGCDALSEGSTLDFPQRSGYVEFKDGVALFVNMPDKYSQDQPRTYPNKWLKDGRILTWFLRKHEWGGGETKLARKLLSDTEERFVILFVRTGKDPFLCCGRCDVIVPEAIVSATSTATDTTTTVNGWGLMQLNLHLVDFAALSDSDAFQDLVGY